MSLEQTKSKITARIWQSIAQSGVSLSAIPKDQLDTLVDSIADGVLLAVDEAIEDAGMAARQNTAAVLSETANDEETVLWEGRPFLSFVSSYQITNQRVRLIHGILGKDRDDIELTRVQDIDLTQGITERVLNIGDIVISSADPSTPQTELRNITNPQQVHEILRRAMLEARKRYRYTIQEEM